MKRTSMPPGRPASKNLVTPRRDRVRAFTSIDRLEANWNSTIGPTTMTRGPEVRRTDEFGPCVFVLSRKSAETVEAITAPTDIRRPSG